MTGPGRRRYPSTLGGLVYIGVILTSVVGLTMVAIGPWRRGITLIGLALLFAATMRLFIREDEAGMLRVRSRWFDVTALAVAGVSLIALATNIPDQPLA